MRSAEVARTGKWMILITAVLLVLGVLMVYSASSFASMKFFGNNHHYLLGHVIRVMFGVALGIAAYIMPSGFWRMASIPMYLFSVLLLVVTVCFSGE